MSKLWIGGFFGKYVKSDILDSQISGVYDQSDVYYLKREGSWYSPLQATGGTVVDDAGYRMHIFTSPGSFVVSSVPPTVNTVEYLVVAGGASGGAHFGGGGGAGGFRTATGFPVTTTTYPITVAVSYTHLRAHET